MDKKAFMDLLKKKMKDESYETVCQIIDYYEEMIDDLMEDGMSEVEAIASLGDIDDLLQETKGNENVIIKDQSKKSMAMTGVLLFLGFPLWGSLLAAVLLLILSAYILIWCVPILTGSLAIAGVICFIVGIFGSFPLFIQSLPLGITQLGMSAIFGAVGIMGVVFTSLTSRKILLWSKNITDYARKTSIQMLRKVGIVC